MDLQTAHSSPHHTVDVLLCGAASGAFAGLLTNGLEAIAVKKQTNRKFSVIKLMRKKGQLWDVMFAGTKYRIFYYGMHGLILFGLLEKLKELLNVETMED